MTQGEVTFADWEACNVGPFLWDLVYCTSLGWTATARRQFQDQILALYLTGLNANGRELLSTAEAKNDVKILTLVLAFVSRTIRTGGRLIFVFV
jgi:hypothetical protein